MLSSNGPNSSVTYLLSQLTSRSGTQERWGVLQTSRLSPQPSAAQWPEKYPLLLSPPAQVQAAEGAALQAAAVAAAVEAAGDENGDNRYFSSFKLSK
jgi:hypothetical protein